MALSSVDDLRVRIADRPRLVLEEVLGEGDGVRLFYQVQMYPVLQGQEVISVAGTVKSRGGDYSIEYDTGLITFSTASIPALGAEVKANKYEWATFSEDELTGVLEDHGGDVIRAAIEVIQWLLADTDRFMKYFLGQEMVDRNIGVRALEGLLKRLKSVLGAPAGVVRADTDNLETGMEPFIEQESGLFD